MEKKIYRIITIVFIIIFLVGIHSKSFATDTFTLDNIIEDARQFIIDGEGENKFTQGSIENMIKSIYNILLVIGIIAVVIVGIILSIQFITGGLEEQAKVKEMLTPYIVGSVVIFASFTIWALVVNILQAVDE